MVQKNILFIVKHFFMRFQKQIKAVVFSLWKLNRKIDLIRLMPVLVLTCLACRQSGKEPQVPVDTDTDAIYEEIPDTTDAIVEYDETEPVKISKDTAVLASFVYFEHDGLLLPSEYKLYNDIGEVVGRIRVDSISEVKILKKSEGKHPQLTNQDYCEWANYIELVYNKDTLIVFGNTVLNISSTEENLTVGTKKIDLIIAENFTVEAGDEEGLTGCDDFSYLVVKTLPNEYSLIYPYEAKKNPYLKYAVLIHDEGMSEEIDDIQGSNDTLILKIDVGYQDGSGEYNLKIFKSGTWKFRESDRKTEY